MIKYFLRPLANTIKTTTFCSDKMKVQLFKPKDIKSLQTKEYVAKDAERVFDNFFKEHPPKESEKFFFDMNLNDKHEMLTFDPYKTLGLQTGASKQKVKQAYRQLAMKYHPKNDPSVQAGEKFIDIARAYEMLILDKGIKPKKMIEQKQSDQSSLMFQFNDSVKQCISSTDNSPLAPAEQGKSRVKPAQLYSESTNVKRLGHRKEVRIEKEYNCGKNLKKITRIENFHQDGSIEITETYNDGHDIKTNHYIQAAGVKQSTPIDRHIQWDKDHLFATAENCEDEKAGKDQKDNKKSSSSPL